MAQYEYKILSGLPKHRKFMESLEKYRKISKWENLEEEVNTLTGDGWEVVSSYAVPVGSFLERTLCTAFVLRKAKDA